MHKIFNNTYKALTTCRESISLFTILFPQQPYGRGGEAIMSLCITDEETEVWGDLRICARMHS